MRKWGWSVARHMVGAVLLHIPSMFVIEQRQRADQPPHFLTTEEPAQKTLPDSHVLKKGRMSLWRE